MICRNYGRLTNVVQPNENRKYEKRILSNTTAIYMFMIKILFLLTGIFILISFLLGRRFGIEILKGFKPKVKSKTTASFWKYFSFVAIIFVASIITLTKFSNKKNQLKVFSEISSANFNKVNLYCHDLSSSEYFKHKGLSITDKNRIEQYQKALLDKDNITATHPLQLWTIKVIFFLSNSDTYTFLVSKYDNSEIIITYYGLNDQYCRGNGNFYYRNDSIEDLIIEDFSKLDK